MSDAIYPALSTQLWPIEREPMIDGVYKQVTATGREFTSSLSTYPRWEYTLRYAALSGARYDWQRLVDFFVSRNGPVDTFLLRDRHDDRVTRQILGSTNGVQTQWQLGRALSNVPVNLLGRSDAPLTGWTVMQGTVTQSAPSTDVMRAAQFMETTATGFHGLRNSNIWLVPGERYTVVAKTKPIGGRDVLRLEVMNDGTGDQIGSANVTHSVGVTATGGPGFVAAGFEVLPGGMGLQWVTFTAGATDAVVEVDVRGVSAGASNYAGVVTAGFHVADLSLYRGDFIGALPGNIGAGAALQALEPVFDVSGLPVLELLNTSSGAITAAPAFTVSATGMVTFSAAPASGSLLLATMQYYKRVRFTEKSQTLEQFTHDLHRGKVKMVTAKP